MYQDETGTYVYESIGFDEYRRYFTYMAMEIKPTMPVGRPLAPNYPAGLKEQYVFRRNLKQMPIHRGLQRTTAGSRPLLKRLLKLDQLMLQHQ